MDYKDWRPESEWGGTLGVPTSQIPSDSPTDLREESMYTTKGEAKGVQTGMLKVFDYFLFYFVELLLLDLLNVKYTMHSTFAIYPSHMQQFHCLCTSKNYPLKFSS